MRGARAVHASNLGCRVPAAPSSAHQGVRRGVRGSLLSMTAASTTRGGRGELPHHGGTSSRSLRSLLRAPFTVVLLLTQPSRMPAARRCCSSTYRHRDAPGPSGAAAACAGKPMGSAPETCPMRAVASPRTPPTAASCMQTSSITSASATLSAGG